MIFKKMFPFGFTLVNKLSLKNCLILSYDKLYWRSSLSLPKPL